MLRYFRPGVMAVLFSLAVVLGVVAFQLRGESGAAPVAKAQVPSNAGPNRVVQFDEDHTIFGRELETIIGTHLDGRCKFDVPPLSLRPGEPAVKRNVITVDYGQCILTYEQGNVVAKANPEGGASLSTTTEHIQLPSATLGKGLTFHPLSPPAGYQQAHYKIEWWDIANIEVNAAYSYIFWDTNGTCVTDAWGEEFLWWQPASGWSHVADSFGAFYSPGLGCTRVQAQIYAAHFHNGVFCAGQNTDTYYDGVIVAGDYSGNIFGWRNNTWTTEPWWCPPLHWTDQLGYDY